MNVRKTLFAAALGSVLPFGAVHSAQTDLRTFTSAEIDLGSSAPLRVGISLPPRLDSRANADDESSADSVGATAIVDFGIRG